ncbi:Hypothetical predicted protein [Paramuricea clavata]|nr:Hypothetical predicted protein [Paramuricea clavata]
MEVELQGQDLKSVIEMEDNLLKQKGETFVHIWRMILDVLFNNGRISEIYRRESIAKLEQAVEDIHRNNELEHEKESKRLRSEIEDPSQLEEALESLHSSYSKKIVSEFTELQNSAANDLKEKSQLSEEEANAIIMKVQSNLAASEKFFVEEQTRQSMVLQEKLLRRQALVQLRDQMNDQETEAIENLPKKHREAFDKLCQDNQNLESQRDEILSEYEQDLARLQENHEHNVLAQQNKLALKLKQKREERIQLLALRQQQEKEEHYKKTCQQVSEGEMDLEAFVQEQTNLKKKHTMEREDEEGQADKTEAEELERLRQHLEEEREKKIQSYEENIVKKMATMAQLSNEDVQQFMEEHRKDMAVYNDKLEETKSQQRSQLKERIEARKAKLERERAQHKNEQTQLITQQEEVIDQVLKMQVGLTEEARKQVMAEHEQNLMNLNNHLQITRLRQQKRLEERLAQRKAKLAEMKKSQEEELSRNDPDKQESLAKEQNKAYEEEIKKLENEHDKALEDLRRRLALETEEALKEQDKKLGEILGKHQVGVARRDEIIRRQNETIKAIEEKMVDKITKEGTFAENTTEKILKQHQRQIIKLETKINEAKQAQERNMYQKLEAKRLKKEKALSAEMNDKAEQQKKKGVRSATRVMMNSLAQTQLKHKLEELRREMEMELSKQKEELNRIMEEKLMEELQLHEKNFITQLASISHMNEEEIAKICKEAVTESGGDQQTSKKISKDLRKRIRNTKQDAVV